MRNFLILIYIFASLFLFSACLETENKIQALGTVTGAVVVDGSLTGVDIQDNSIDAVTKLSSSCSDGQILESSAGNFVCAPNSGSDDLGNHVATQNLDLSTFSLVGGGGSNGIRVANNGAVALGGVAPDPAIALHVNSASDSGRFQLSGILNGGSINLQNNILSPPADTIMGQVAYSGFNSASAVRSYAQIRTILLDPIATTEDSMLLFRTTTSGAIENRMAISPTGVGIGTIAPLEALEVIGNVLADNVVVPSDLKFKKNLVPIKDSLAKLKKITGYEYVWNEKARLNINQKSIGVIAQEIELQFPELIMIQNEGKASEYRTVNYQGMIAPIINAIKEIDSDAHKKSELLEKEISILKDENELLRQEIYEIKTLLLKISKNKK